MQKYRNVDYKCMDVNFNENEAGVAFIIADLINFLTHNMKLKLIIVI